jgi:hypothetical protein
MTIIAILFAAGAYGEIYVALGERTPWGTLFVAVVLAYLSYAAARMVEAAAVNAMASSLSVAVPTSSAT